jgi:hypothetical protein
LSARSQFSGNRNPLAPLSTSTRTATRKAKRNMTARIKKDLGPDVTPPAISVAMIEFRIQNTASRSRSIDLPRPPDQAWEPIRTTAFTPSAVPNSWRRKILFNQEPRPPQPFCRRQLRCKPWLEDDDSKTMIQDFDLANLILKSTA